MTGDARQEPLSPRTSRVKRAFPQALSGGRRAVQACRGAPLVPRATGFGSNAASRGLRSAFSSRRFPHLTDPRIMLFETADGVRVDLVVFINCRCGHDIQCETGGGERTGWCGCAAGPGHRGRARRRAARHGGPPGMTGSRTPSTPSPASGSRASRPAGSPPGRPLGRLRRDRHHRRCRPVHGVRAGRERRHEAPPRPPVSAAPAPAPVAHSRPPAPTA